MKHISFPVMQFPRVDATATVLCWRHQSIARRINALTYGYVKDYPTVL
jgi:hypothetical protein